MPTPEPKATVYTAAELQGMTFEEPKWAVPTLLPVGLALIAGKPKIGKSWLALGLGLAIAYGGVALGKIPVEQGEVLYLALEDRWQRLQSRLQKLAPNGKWPEMFHLSPDWPRSDRGGLQQLFDWLTAHPKCRLVIVDTLPRFRRRVQGGARSQFDEDHLTGESMKSIADHFGIALVVICHLRKLDADDPFDTIGGTIGLTAVSDTNLVILRARGEGEATLWITGRDVDEGKLAMRWDNDLASWALVGSADDYARTKERRDIIRVLVDSGQALNARDVASVLKRKPETIRQRMWQMCQAGEISSVGDGRYMAISVTHNGRNATPVTTGTSVTSVTTVTQNEHKPNGRPRCVDCGIVLVPPRVLRCQECDERELEWLQEAAQSQPPDDYAND